MCQYEAEQHRPKRSSQDLKVQKKHMNEQAVLPSLAVANKHCDTSQCKPPLIARKRPPQARGIVKISVSS